MEYGSSTLAQLAVREPATSKENALWLLERLVPGTGLNNIGVAIQVQGRLSRAALTMSIAIMLDRYRTLRTIYFATDTELERELAADGLLEVTLEELDADEDRPEHALREFVGRAFTLDGQLLIRAGIAAHADGDIICVAAHHLVFDAASCVIFMRELIPVYEAVAAGRPVPRTPAAQVTAFCVAEPSAADLAYWRDSLRGFVPDSLGLWCGAPCPPLPLMTGDSVPHTLSPPARRALRQLQREVRAPAVTLQLAAYYILLAAHGAGPDLVIGTPLDLRGLQAVPAIGYHVNVAPLRLRVDFDESFREFARRARDVFLAAMAHADVSVDDMSAELPRAGSSWQTTFYRHMFNYLPGAGSEDLAIDGMTARALSVENGFSKFDLELLIFADTGKISLRYRTEILARADVEAMLRRYEALLIAVAADSDRRLGEIAGWSEADRAVIDHANQTARSGYGFPSAVAGLLADAETTRVFIASPDGRELPVGLRGELCIANGAVAPASAADDPRSGHHLGYGGYYRTGHLARWAADGTLTWLGRTGRQAVIAGSPVNLDEVDAALRAHAGVRDAAALSVPLPGGDVLIAFVEAAGDLAGSVRAHALANLSTEAMPGHIICVDTLPKDAEGQVDLAALASAVQAYVSGWAGHALDAGDPLVQELMRLWRQLLDVDVTPDTVFFAAGGHSLLAAKLAQDIEELTGIYLDLSEVFNYPTPAALAARLKAVAADDGP